MTTSLQLPDRTITADEILPLLNQYQLLPKLVQEMLIDRAIAPFTCTTEERNVLCNAFFATNSIAESDRQPWLAARGLTLEEVLAPLERKVKLAKFKEATWGHKIGSYFLQRKPQLDRVICSIIRHRNCDVIQELYFRLQENEQSFVELAQQYSQGPEAHTKGILGPIELGQLHPQLAQILRTAQPQQLVKAHVEGWFFVAQVEAILPAQLDEPMQQQLLDELFQQFIQQETANYLPYLNA